MPAVFGLAGLLVAAVLAFGAGFALGRRALYRRNLGEALVAQAIACGLDRRHVLLNNVTLESGGETTQIDHVLVADTGIFVLETKHYQGWIFGSPHAAQWTQVIYQHKSRFQNPLRQNYGHLKAVQSLLTLPDEAFIPLVVFTGEAEFKSELGAGVLRLDELVAYLDAERPVWFDERKLAYIVGRIEMKRLRRSLETEEYHLNWVQSRLGPQRT